MPKFVQKFFWWCAGADRELLPFCPQSDHIKQAGYGSLVLIPAVLAVVSMTYAVSTLTTDLSKSLGIGLGWGLVVFTFDRFIVSSLRKSQTVLKDVLSVTFLTRLLLAILVGIIVAHPLVMFVFKDSIAGRLDERRESEIRRINGDFDEQAKPQQERKKELAKEISQIQTDTDQQRAQKENAFAEISHRRRRRGAAAQIRRWRDEIVKERGVRIGKVDVEISKLDNRIAEVESERKKRLGEYNQARDYLARELALSDLVNSNAMVRWTQWLLILLFVLVDIMPITFKALTKRETYDVLLDSSHRKAAEAASQEDALRASLWNQTSAYQLQKIEDLLKEKRNDPVFSTVLNGDIDEILKHSLIGRRPQNRITDISEGAVSTTATVKTVNGRGRWGRFKKRAVEKGVDLAIGVICIPLQAIAAYAFFMYSGRDVLAFVSPSTLLQILPLFILNFGLSKLVSGSFKQSTTSEI